MSNKYDMTCSCCGAKLDLDLDNLQVYCPYCGNKLMIDMSQLSQILVEKEKTKREQIKSDCEVKVKEIEHKKTVLAGKLLIFLILCGIGFTIFLMTFFRIRYGV